MCDFSHLADKFRAGASTTRKNSSAKDGGSEAKLENRLTSAKELKPNTCHKTRRDLPSLWKGGPQQVGPVDVCFDG